MLCYMKAKYVHHMLAPPPPPPGPAVVERPNPPVGNVPIQAPEHPPEGDGQPAVNDVLAPPPQHLDGTFRRVRL